MYKVFNNYPENCPLSEVLRITMENIKTFLCDIAPNTDFTDTTDINTPVPSGDGIPEYIKETTPLIFYSDVVDNNNPDFTIDNTTKFKISEYAYPGYPVYCVFYSWIKHPILIFVTNKFNWVSSDAKEISLFGNLYDSFLHRPHICIGFDLSVFNVDNVSEKVEVEPDYAYCQRIYVKSGPYLVDPGIYDVVSGTFRETFTYENCTSKSSPFLILDPFYSGLNSFFDVVSDDPISKNIHNFGFAISLYNHTLCFYSGTMGKRAVNVADTVFISKLPTNSISGCDLHVSDDAIICKSDAVAYAYCTTDVNYKYKNSYLSDSVINRLLFAVFGHTTRMGDPHSFVPENLPLAIFGVYADSNIGDDINLYHDSYKVSWNSIRNVSMIANYEKRPMYKVGRYYCKEDIDIYDTRNRDDYIGSAYLIRNWMVPTIITSFQPSFFDGDNLKLDIFDLPNFPTLTNGGIEYPHNDALITSMALKGDSEVFTRGFPTQTNNQLNDHFIAYSINIYVKREPLEANTHSLLCTLNFMFACQRLYDADDRWHEYNYLDKKFIGISNRYTGLLFLVDDYKELIT